MTINIPTYSEKILNKFAEEQWEKALAFLQKQYSMSMEDCKDVFQDSFIALYNNIIRCWSFAKISNYFN